MAEKDFAEAVYARLKDAEECLTIVVNDRTVCDYAQNGRMTNVRDEECAILAATPDAGLHLRRLKDGHEISFQWRVIGSIRLVAQ